MRDLVLAVIGGVVVAFWAALAVLAPVGWLGRSVARRRVTYSHADSTPHAVLEGDPDALIEHVRKLFAVAAAVAITAGLGAAPADARPLKAPNAVASSWTAPLKQPLPRFDGAALKAPRAYWVAP